MNEKDKMFKIKFNDISNSYVLVEDKKKYNFSPRVFAQKFFYKLGEEKIEESEEKNETLEEETVSKSLPKKEQTRLKMIFKEGACDLDGEIDALAEEVEPISQRPPQPPINPPRPPIGPQPPRPPMPPRPPQPIPPLPPRPPQNQPAELARDIYNKLLIQNVLYEDLITYNTKYNDELRDMISELRIITFAMLRIYQTLSGRNNIPIQNQRKPRFNGFCNGVVTSINWLRGIMFDIRSLQRMVNISNIDQQLIIINFTLQSQMSELQDMREDCIQGGLL